MIAQVAREVAHPQGAASGGRGHGFGRFGARGQRTGQLGALGRHAGARAAQQIGARGARMRQHGKSHAVGVVLIQLRQNARPERGQIVPAGLLLPVAHQLRQKGRLVIQRHAFFQTVQRLLVLAQLEQRARAAHPRVRVARIALASLFVAGGGGLRLIQRHFGIATADPQAAVPWRHGQAAPGAGQGVLELPPVFQRRRQRVPVKGVGRRQPRGLLQALHRLGQTPQIAQRIAAQQPGGRLRRIEREGAVGAGQRFLQPLGGMQRAAPVAPQGGIRRSQRHGGVKVADGLLCKPLLTTGHAQHGPSASVFPVERGRLLQGADRVGPLRGHQTRQAQHLPGQRIARLRLQVLAQQLRGLRQAALAGQTRSFLKGGGGGACGLIHPARCLRARPARSRARPGRA